MSNGVTSKIILDDCILRALKEDITNEDITTCSVMRKAVPVTVDLICKQDGILCGLDVYKRVFELLDDHFIFTAFFEDGDRVLAGNIVGTLKGDGRAILSGERTALNFLQRMSGIATLTRSMADELTGFPTQLLDTRKTTPNLRPFEKYAVKTGGGCNHRYNLSDGILLKDNHIGAAGSVRRAVAMAREYAPFIRKIEVEVETLEMLDEALKAGADIIMLDNMDNETIRQAIAKVNKRAQVEVSGNISIERLHSLAEIGVDFISVGALTHSAPILDFSMKNLHPIE